MAKRKTGTMASVGVRNPAVITDGCNPELVKGAEFDGIFEIPVIKAPEIIALPKAMVPFSKRDRVIPSHYAVCEYENDIEFADLLRDPNKYAREFRKYQAVISPDASLYWDAPFAAQVVNKYRNHAIGYYLQKKGVYVIPNVRWGDERTYTTCMFSQPLAFLGVEKHSIVSIGTYGVVKTALEKQHFKAGLKAMIEYLEPRIVLVYGSMPKALFEEVEKKTVFYRYPDWTTYTKKVKTKAEE